MKSALRFLALVFALFGVGSAQAQFTVYTDRAAWQAAVGSFAQESFDDADISAFTLVEIGTGHSYGVTGGRYMDRVVGEVSFTIYSFESATAAFGADWDLTLGGGLGQGLLLAVDGVAVGPQIGNDYRGFFGFTSTRTFDAVMVFGGSLGGMAETHSVDNLVYATAMPVPEPSTYVLMIVGLLAIGLLVSRHMK